MIVYQKTKEEFSNDILTNDIDAIIVKQIKEKTGNNTSPTQITAFRNSLSYVDKVLHDPGIPDDCGISIEYHIPQTCKRIDLIISGSDGIHDNVIIIELKQWSESKLTTRDGIVETKFQGRFTQTSHPSYQAWSYAALLQAFNATVDEEDIQLHPCAYLHNYAPDDIIDHEFYSYYTKKAPVFLKPDALKLREFIKRFMKYGDRSNIIARIDSGKIKPTKSLIDSMKSMLKGNQEFIMIDEQKVVFENIIETAKHSHDRNKNVIIVEGGPGTGKSVVAVNALVELNRKGFMAQYVTKTSAPRDVYFAKLKGDMRMTEIKNLFVGSGSFMSAPKNAISTLLVDEAHRLTEKTGFLNMGDNQVKEIINTALCSVFFIDEDQRIHLKDYANISVIEYFAKQAGAHIQRWQLESQFRCAGSDGYLAWLDHMLEIRETANLHLQDAGFEYDFRVLDSPIELRDMIFEKNRFNNKARLVAGYCWDWKSKKDPSAMDISFPNVDFAMQWNLTKYDAAWLIDPNSVEQVGCIHTCQGLEVDYIGVIIGDDLTYQNGMVTVNPAKRSRDDKSIQGYKKLLEKDPEKAIKTINAIVKNTYRTLMSRGMKGCYIYCVDPSLQEYFKDLLVQ